MISTLELAAPCTGSVSDVQFPLEEDKKANGKTEKKTYIDVFDPYFNIRSNLSDSAFYFVMC